MRFLIDTHCWIWATESSGKLNDTAAEMILSGENTVFFSAISAAEIAIKVRLGKLKLPQPVAESVPGLLEKQRVTPMALDQQHALRVADLPLHHRDPFDRLLIAQAQAEGIPLMTADTKIAEYDVDIIWAGREEAPPRQVQ